MSSIKKYALDNNLTVFQPKNLKNSTFIENLKSLDLGEKIYPFDGEYHVVNLNNNAWHF
jgi:hypothetical protein